MFAKIGDSITAAPEFLRCFDGGPVVLGTAAPLAPTIAHFLQGDAAGRSPFARVSVAAIAGATVQDALAGSPCAVERELDTIDPRIAVIMFGTNDVRYGRSLEAFAADLWTLVDLVIARGTIPLLSTIPANNGDAWADARIPWFNRAIRAIAQGRRIPLVDLHHVLAPLPARGLSSDGIHPSVAASGGCLLTEVGLTYGYNARNLITIEALDRTRAALGGSPADATAPVRAGRGLVGDPFIGALPLLDLHDTRAGVAAIASYGCGGPAQVGHEVVYRLALSAPVTIEAHVITRGQTDVDVHLLVGGATPTACVASGDRRVTATVGPGTAFIVVDAPAVASEGEYLLIVAATN